MFCKPNSFFLFLYRHWSARTEVCQHFYRNHLLYLNGLNHPTFLLSSLEQDIAAAVMSAALLVCNLGIPMIAELWKIKYLSNVV